MTANVIEFIDSEFKVYFNEEEGNCEAVSSTRVLDEQEPGRWQMCKETEFFGACRDVVEDIPCKKEDSDVKYPESVTMDGNRNHELPKTAMNNILKLRMKPYPHYSVLSSRYLRTDTEKRKEAPEPHESSEVSSSSDDLPPGSWEVYWVCPTKKTRTENVEPKKSPKSSRQSPDSLASEALPESPQVDTRPPELEDFDLEKVISETSEASPKKASSPEFLKDPEARPDSPDTSDQSRDHPLSSLESLEYFLGDPPGTSRILPEQSLGLGSPSEDPSVHR